MKKLKDFYWLIKGITVYALVGESGTGKSFRAKLLTQKYGIELLIDDGLLIRDDKILAGHSAKREKTFLGAVKVAVFDDKEHRDEVAEERLLHGWQRHAAATIGKPHEHRHQREPERTQQDAGHAFPH